MKSNGIISLETTIARLRLRLRQGIRHSPGISSWRSFVEGILQDELRHQGRRRMKKVILILHLLASASLAFAGSNTGADFLKIPVGAEALGLGQAYTALASGVNSLNWNPSGIAKMPTSNGRSRSGFSYSHQELLFGSNLDQIGVAFPNALGEKNMSLGFSVLRLDHPAQEGRDQNRNVTGNFNASDLSVGTALAYSLGSVQVGTQMKFIRQALADVSAQGIAFDFGFLSETPFKSVSLGGSVRNLGPKMEFISEEFNLPLTLSLGAAFKVTDTITLGLDTFARPYQDETSLAIGSEYQALSAVTLRLGYLAKLAETIVNNQESETNRGNISGFNGMNAGIGLNIKSFSLDYALSQFGELGLTHSMTVSTHFGGREKSQPIISPYSSEFSELMVEELNGERTIVIFNFNDSDPLPRWDQNR